MSSLRLLQEGPQDVGNGLALKTGDYHIPLRRTVEGLEVTGGVWPPLYIIKQEELGPWEMWDSELSMQLQKERLGNIPLEDTLSEVL